MEKAWLLIVGASLTLVKETVTVAWLLKVPVPLSCTFTTRAKEGVTSKFNAEELATESTPVEALIAKAPDVFPERME